MATVNFKGAPINLTGSTPSVGSKAPAFSLVDHELKDRTLSEFLGKKVLISVVPSLDTPVCSLSTKKFNESLSTHKEVVALIVSADLPFAQKRLCGAENLTHIITLSMMRSKDFAKNYGVLIENGPLAGLAARAIFVLDTQGNITYSELVKEVTQEPNYDKALEALFS